MKLILRVIAVHLIIAAPILYGMHIRKAGGAISERAKKTTHISSSPKPNIIIPATPTPPLTQPEPELKPAVPAVPQLSKKQSAFRELMQEFKTTFDTSLSPNIVQKLDDALAGKKVTFVKKPASTALLAPDVAEEIAQEVRARELSAKQPTRPSLSEPSPEEILEQQAIEAELQRLQKEASKGSFGSL